MVVPERFNVEDLPDGSSVIRNNAGEITAKRAAASYYFDPVGAPLAGVTAPEQLDQFDALFERWDYPDYFDEPLEAMATRAKALYESTDRAVGVSWQLHHLQAGQFMRGYEQFLVDLMVEKDLVHAMLGKLHEVHMRRIDAFLEAFGPWFDIVLLTDDLGTQQAPMISPSVYREMIFPYISKAIERIKAAGKKVVMHSCGAVSSFVPMMIEMGVDALNPIQVSSPGMNPRDLVREFGQDIAFWGGGINTQGALNATDPKIVREDVRRRIDEFGPDAPWVFATVHNIQYDVPAENVLAMHDEFLKQTRG